MIAFSEKIFLDKLLNPKEQEQVKEKEKEKEKEKSTSIFPQLYNASSEKVVKEKRIVQDAINKEKSRHIAEKIVIRPSQYSSKLHNSFPDKEIDTQIRDIQVNDKIYAKTNAKLSRQKKLVEPYSEAKERFVQKANRTNSRKEDNKSISEDKNSIIIRNIKKSNFDIIHQGYQSNAGKKSINKKGTHSQYRDYSPNSSCSSKKKNFFFNEFEQQTRSFNGIKANYLEEAKTISQEISSILSSENCSNTKLSKIVSMINSATNLYCLEIKLPKVKMIYYIDNLTITSKFLSKIKKIPKMIFNNIITSKGEYIENLLTSISKISMSELTFVDCDQDLLSRIGMLKDTLVLNKLSFKKCKFQSPVLKFSQAISEIRMNKLKIVNSNFLPDDLYILTKHINISKYLNVLDISRNPLGTKEISNMLYLLGIFTKLKKIIVKNDDIHKLNLKEIRNDTGFLHEEIKKIQIIN